MYVAARIAAEEEDTERAEKMRLVLAEQAEAYRTDVAEHGGPAPEVGEDFGIEVLDLVPDHWPADLATTYLIDLIFSVPFSPNHLNYDEDVRRSALRAVARHVGLLDSLV